MNTPLVIREEKSQDFHASEVVVRRAFFNRQNPGCNEHYLVHVLRGSPDYLAQLSRLAVKDGRIVGAIYFSKAFLKASQGVVPVLTFGPLAVDPVFQGQGIARTLFEETRDLAREAGYPAIIIYGEPEYYPRLGFRRAKEFGITDPQGEVYDPLMVYELHPDALKGIQGKFFESPVFEKANDQKALAEFDNLFPSCPKLKVPSQWLHENDLGQVLGVEGQHYEIAFWEIAIPAVLAKSYSSPAPKVGDYVTFRWNHTGLSQIQTLEIPE
jgi:Predicted acetyltransferase